MATKYIEDVEDGMVQRGNTDIRIHPHINTFHNFLYYNTRECEIELN